MPGATGGFFVMSAHPTSSCYLGFLESDSRRREYYELVENVDPACFVEDTVRVIDILDLERKTGKFLVTYPMYEYRLNGLHRLIKFYKIPSAFLSERVQGVAHSFGVRESIDHRYDSWFHYLCKNVRTHDDPRDDSRREIAPWPAESCDDGPTDAEPAVAVPFTRRLLGQLRSVMQFSRLFNFAENRLPSNLPPGPTSCTSRGNDETNDIELESMHPSNAEDYSWIMGGCFTSWDRRKGKLVLLFFGDQSIMEVEERLRSFLESNPENAKAADTYQDAGKQHEKIIKMTHAQLDFVRLHNVAKHVIHLLESSEAAIETIKSMQSAHQKLLSNDEHTTNMDSIVNALGRIQGIASDLPISSKDENPRNEFGDFVGRETESNLQYIMGLFHSTNLRLRSLEKRINNTINLSFQLHNQMDSIMLQGDSISMRTIAIVTLVFLPTNTVATIFGVQSFGVQSNGIASGLSKTFGIFWSIVIPITLITLFIWQVAHQRSLRMRHNFMASVSSVEKGGHRRVVGNFPDSIGGDVLRALTV
ncbi:hypothetical protein BDD12DRAFT_800646 [Trichophaea hybrida]|nr:hypothetical protein BDD12DRAFT_800646 [Trichophaea hybrida]